VSVESGAYTAEGLNVPIVNDGATFEELKGNVQDAVALLLEGDDPVTLGFGPSSSILTNYDRGRSRREAESQVRFIQKIPTRNERMNPTPSYNREYASLWTDIVVGCFSKRNLPSSRGE
jgi:hypothetical protein